MPGRAVYKFEEFYRAFGRSVSADVILTEGQVHIVPRDPFKRLEDDRRAGDVADSRGDASPSVERGSSSPRSPSVETEERRGPQTCKAPTSTDAQLPERVAALLELQEPDGSWKFTDAFSFVLNGVAPEPVSGISGKLWATAVALNVWRQSPELFPQLQYQYDRALLHADENVLRIARAHLDLTALNKIRYYRSEEAHALREQRAREVAAQRKLEDEEYERVKRAREFEEQMMEQSMEQARRMPAPTQKLIVSTMESEVKCVFQQKPDDKSFKVGECVECCYRRVDGGATRAVRHAQWFPCRITFVDATARCTHVEYLDGDGERVRRVPFKFLRRLRVDEQLARGAEFERLRATWLSPSPFQDEIDRLQEIQARNAQRGPWNQRFSCDQPLTRSPNKAENIDSAGFDPDRLEPRPPSRSRPLILRPLSSSSLRLAVDKQQQIDQLFRAALATLMTYDRAHAKVRSAVKTGCNKYATAVLYRERFHAFDDFGAAVKELVEATVDVLDAIRAWKERLVASSGKAARSAAFMWNGSDFTHTVARSLDFLGDLAELVEWYGEEFPFDMNPFMLSDTLVDKAEELGLEVLVHSTKPSSGSLLRAALRLHKREVSDGSPPPTWWPEFQYSPKLHRRIEAAEEFLMHELVARGVIGIPTSE